MKSLRIEPITSRLFADLETLFKAPGCSIARGCWCMYYRVSGKQQPLPGCSIAESNHQRFKALVEGGATPGLIAYGRTALGEEPMGWISLGPRDDYRKLARSPVMKPVDERPVWSVVCFVVPSKYRGQGVATALLKAGIAYARKQGARLIEAYPIDKPKRSHDEFLWFGAKSMYDKQGFTEVARRKPTRPIVRKSVRPQPSGEK